MINKNSLIKIAGTIWFAVGLFLLTLGVKFIITISKAPSHAYLSTNFSFLKLFPAMSYQTVLMWVIVCGLAIGSLKGRFVFKRSVIRQVTRISALENPTLKDLYSKGYYILMASMIGLGMVMRFLPITLEVRGCVDIAIGSALIQGALHYFKQAATNAKKELR